MLSDKAAERMRDEAIKEGRDKLGCTCVPDVELVEVAPSAWVSLVEHKEPCAFLRRQHAEEN